MHRECRERFPRRQFQRKPLVSNPGMHHGTCVTHVPWCMSGSLTCGDGENVPGIPGACAPAILRIWQEAHGCLCYVHLYPDTCRGVYWYTVYCLQHCPLNKCIPQSSKSAQISILPGRGETDLQCWIIFVVLTRVAFQSSTPLANITNITMTAWIKDHWM